MDPFFTIQSTQHLLEECNFFRWSLTITHFWYCFWRQYYDEARVGYLHHLVALQLRLSCQCNCDKPLLLWDSYFLQMKAGFRLPIYLSNVMMMCLRFLGGRVGFNFDNSRGTLSTRISTVLYFSMEFERFATRVLSFGNVLVIQKKRRGRRGPVWWKQNLQTLICTFFLSGKPIPALHTPAPKVYKLPIVADSVSAHKLLALTWQQSMLWALKWRRRSDNDQYCHCQYLPKIAWKLPCQRKRMGWPSSEDKREIELSDDFLNPSNYQSWYCSSSRYSCFQKCNNDAISKFPTKRNTFRKQNESLLKKNGERRRKLGRTESRHWFCYDIIRTTWSIM